MVNDEGLMKYLKDRGVKYTKYFDSDIIKSNFDELVINPSVKTTIKKVNPSKIRTLITSLSNNGLSPFPAGT